MILTYFVLAVLVVSYTIYTFVVIWGCFAVIQSMPSCTQMARFLAPTVLMSMVIPATIEVSLRHEIVSYVADQTSNFQFSLKQLLSRLWPTSITMLNSPVFVLNLNLAATSPGFLLSSGFSARIISILNCNILWNIAYDQSRFP